MLGIVLARRDWREADQIITLYTQELGKREALARGVKKITAKNSPFLEPGSLVEAEAVAGREQALLTSVEPVSLWPGIRPSLPKIICAATMLATVECLTPVGEPDEPVFTLLREALTQLNGAKEITPLFLAAFWFRLAVALGFGPELERCVHCGATRSFTGFDVAAGGVVCRACQVRDNSESNTKARTIISLSASFLDFLATVVRGSWEDVFNVKFSLSEAKKMLTLAKNFLAFHTGATNPPRRFWEQLSTGR
jgi:DNA repair protein RecO (recombination protein O)